MQPKKFRSDALESVHDMMSGLREAGSIDELTMRDFDRACLHSGAEERELIGNAKIA